MKVFIKFLRAFADDQRGLALVMVTAGMVALLGFAALVTDIGLLVLNKERLSNAVDAAALAGAHELPVNPVLAGTTAVNYALLNGCNSDTPLISADNSHPDSKITVTATKVVNFTFARVLGINSGAVSARATARVAGLTSYIGAAPLAVPNQTFDFNTLYTLKQGSNSPDPSPLGSGTYGALSLGGNGAKTYADNLKDGYGQKVSVGEIIDTETGNISNPTVEAIDYRISKSSPSDTYTNFSPDCPRILIIPVYQPVTIESGQVKSIKVVGFAAFFVEKVAGQGNENYIDGYFVKMVANGDSDFSQADYGLQGVKLVE